MVRKGERKLTTVSHKILVAYGPLNPRVGKLVVALLLLPLLVFPAFFMALSDSFGLDTGILPMECESDKSETVGALILLSPCMFIDLPKAYN